MSVLLLAVRSNYLWLLQHHCAIAALLSSSGWRRCGVKIRRFAWTPTDCHVVQLIVRTFIVAAQSGFEKTYLAVLVAVWTFVFAMNVAMLVGAMQRDPELMMPWLVLYVVSFPISSLRLLWISVRLPVLNNVLNMIGALFNLLCLYCVLSYYKELKTARRNKSITDV